MDNFSNNKKRFDREGGTEGDAGCSFFSERIISPHIEICGMDEDFVITRSPVIINAHARHSLSIPPLQHRLAGMIIANNPLPYPQALNWGRSDNVLACPGLIFRFGRVGPPDDGGCCRRAFSSSADRKFCDCSLVGFFFRPCMIWSCSLWDHRIHPRLSGGDGVEEGEIKVR